MRFGRLLIAAVLCSAIICYDFTDYIAEFRKSYSAEEYPLRKANFDANYSRILEANSLNMGYTLKVNEMTDWSQAEVNGIDFIPRSEARYPSRKWNGHQQH